MTRVFGDDIRALDAEAVRWFVERQRKLAASCDEGAMANDAAVAGHLDRVKESGDQPSLFAAERCAKRVDGYSGELRDVAKVMRLAASIVQLLAAGVVRLEGNIRLVGQQHVDVPALTSEERAADWQEHVGEWADRDVATQLRVVQRATAEALAVEEALVARGFRLRERSEQKSTYSGIRSAIYAEWVKLGQSVRVKVIRDAVSPTLRVLDHPCNPSALFGWGKQ